MSIMPAGSFPVSKYRKAIPDWVKIVAAISAYSMIAPMNRPLATELAEWVRGLHYDHRPPLQDRDYDLDKGDFVPAQNDPDYIEAIHAKAHDERTFGRKADAEKTVTTRGSDAGERKHVRHVRDTETLHQLKMEMKRGDPAAISRLLGTVKQRSRLRPKAKIASRPFPKQQRPLRRRA